MQSRQAFESIRQRVREKVQSLHPCLAEASPFARRAWGTAISMRSAIRARPAKSAYLLERFSMGEHRHHLPSQVAFSIAFTMQAHFESLPPQSDRRNGFPQCVRTLQYSSTPSLRYRYEGQSQWLRVIFLAPGQALRCCFVITSADRCQVDRSGHGTTTTQMIHDRWVLQPEDGPTPFAVMLSKC